MTLFARRLFAILALCLFPALAQPAPSVPAPFAPLVPARFEDGLVLVELTPRDADAPPWRMLEWLPSDGATAPRREQVSVGAAVRAMYGYPGSDYFANVKVETSLPGRYEQDRALVIEAMEHNVRRMRALVDGYLAANPEVAARVAAHTPPGKEIIAFEHATVNGIEVIGFTDNVLKLKNGPLSQIHFFVPARETIITAYLLRQQRAKFQDIGEFLRLRAAFIEGYTAYLSR